ncbi:hypothetical protein JYK14_26260 [Siccirubricoccus sp. KC 17139]|uniref:DUF748 domain-containing protein n=1 Tax=Siccirubricoccus soli TaxID=2899147 RepID=A0ABT1DCL2_9PROT|nr:hypothetical protein [Siccirubricoccus soli]MCO6419644.1 hypothetical protein [Siccirubricoccus soli]MCP2685779.1 hypothetical protein [Siccirubricoccus soli]
MQQLGTRTLTVDGVTVFADHADPLQFWYLPAPVALARRPDNSGAFTFIKYRPAAVAGGAKGGGFAMFEVNLRLPPAVEQRIRGQLAALVRGGEPRLSAVPFDEGTVRCIALDLEGSGGTAAPADAPPGTFRAVEAIRGASIPSLAGDNTAAFSLSLSQEGAIILEQAFTQGTAPVGVVYDLKYTILRPALQVTIKAEFERIWRHFSAGLEAQIYWVRAGIDAAFEKLVAEGAIQIEVIDFTGAADREDKEKWALDFFKDNLLAKWFEPSLTPADVESRMAKPEALDAVLKRAQEMAKPLTGGSAAKMEGGTAAKPAEGGATPATPAERPAAALKEVTRTPEPPPGNHAIAHTAAATGLEERVTVTGPAGWTAKVDDKPAKVDGNAIVIDLPADAKRQIEVRWPASTPTPTPPTPTPPATPATTTETFLLFFDKDKPAVTPGFSPTHPVALSYAGNGADDKRFTAASRVDGKPMPQPGEKLGADRLRAWLETLASPRTVTLEGFASFERFPPGKDPLQPEPEARAARDRSLSQQRVAVARASLRGGALVQSDKATGHDQAKALGTDDDPEWRVVRITGKVAGAAPPPPPPPPPAETTPEVVVRGRLERAAMPAKPDKPEEPKKPDKPETPEKPSTPAGSAGTPALVSFRLKAIATEERKTLTLRYNRTEAVQRTYAPQGFFGLLLADLDDPAKHFVEVDLDDPFFREFEVTVDAPIDFGRIGMVSAQLAIDYGDPGAPATVKHADMVFDPAHPEQKKFTTFMSPALATAYRVAEQFHFAPDAGWDGEKLSYEMPPRDTADRTLVVTPHGVLGFHEVTVVAHRIDATAVERIEVELSLTDPATGWVAARTLTVRAGDAPQLWRVRTSAPVTQGFIYTLVHHLKDGTVLRDDPVQSTAQAVAVDDPFDTALDIRFIPLWDPAQVREVFIDVTYADPPNRIDRFERLSFTGADLAIRPLSLSIRDRTQREFTYRVTLIGTDNRMVQRPPETTRETLVGIPG